jgi:hypothetical protein
MIEPSPGGMGLPGFSCLFDAMWAVPRWLGLGVDTVMSRMMHALAGVPAGLAAGGPPSGPASLAAAVAGPSVPAAAVPVAGPSAPAAGAAAGASWPATGPWAIRRPPAAGRGGGGGAEAHGDPLGGPEGGLAASGIKLVEYALVSVRRCAEGILPGGSGEVLVTERMTGVDFAVWMVARYLQSPAYRAGAEGDPARSLRHEDKKYLRVAYRVLTRWAEPPSSGCGDGRVTALGKIQRAVGDLATPSAGAAPPRQVSLPTRSAAPPPVAATRPPSPAAAGEPTATPAGNAADAAGAAAAADIADVAAVLRALHRLGGSAATGDVVRRTNLPRSRVRRALHELEAAGRIRRSGAGLQTRYHEEVKQ